MRRSVAISLLALTLGCGARTGLEVDPPDAAAVDAARPDAEVFDTLRCRWTASRTLLLGGARGATDVRGAAGSSRDVVVVGTVATSTTRRAFEIVPADPSTIRSLHDFVDDPWPEVRPELLAWRDGYVEARAETCSLTWMTTELETLEVQTLAPVPCSIDALSHGGLAVMIDDAPTRVRWVSRDEAPAVDAELGTLPSEPLAPPHAARTSDGLTVVYRDGDDSGLAVVIFSLDGTRAPIAGRIPSPAPLGEPRIATDPVRGGAVVLSRSLEAGWQIHHVELEAGALATFVLSESSAWGVTIEEPPQTFVTNESEALLDVGCTTVVVPLAITEPWTIPPPDTCSGPLRTILRTDTSFGGQVFLSDDGATFSFRALVCNR